VENDDDKEEDDVFNGDELYNNHNENNFNDCGFIFDTEDDED